MARGGLDVGPGSQRDTKYRQIVSKICVLYREVCNALSTITDTKTHKHHIVKHGKEAM